jgi:integrase
MGSLYKRGRVWWVKYYANGRPVRESTGTEKEKAARDYLKAREGRVATGQPILPRVDRIRYDEIAKDLRQHYATTKCRNEDEAEGRLAHLDRFFTGRRVAGIGPAEATDYVLKRQGQGAANGTINRELAVLGRMLRLAYEHAKLLRLPVMRKLKENAPRAGFFEADQYLAVRRHLPPDLRVAVGIAYAFGWRTQSEVLTLERRQLDLAAGTIRLDVGSTKNDDGRVVYLPADLRGELTAHVERVRELERTAGRVIPYLFPHFKGQWRGTRRRDFRKAWAKACVKAGLCRTVVDGPRVIKMPTALRHDFRRTAVRNMVNAGIPERVAMTVTGHKTRAVFDRYHIVSPGDLQDVARKLAGTISGTVPPAALATRRVSL